MSGSGDGIMNKMRKEHSLLEAALAANRFPKVYRHHFFFRDSCRAALLVKKFITSRKQKPSSIKVKNRCAALVALHRQLLRAVESCVQELSASRIDTVTLSLFCIGSLSALGCSVGSLLLANGSGPSTFHHVSQWTLPYVTYLQTSRPHSSSSFPSSLPETDHTRHKAITDDKRSYASIIRTLSGSRRRQGTRRKS